MSSSVVTEPSAAPARPEAPKREPRSRISRLLARPRPAAPGGHPPPLPSRPRARPEAGAPAAATVFFIFSSATAPPFRTLPGLATVLYASSTIGIVAVGVALLMIGGEFDLSSGVAGATPGPAPAVVGFQVRPEIWGGAGSPPGIAPAPGVVERHPG